MAEHGTNAFTEPVGDSVEVTPHHRDERLATELSRAELLQRLSIRLISEQQPEALREEIIDAAMQLLGADAASLQVLEPDGQRLRLLASRNLHPQSQEYWAHVDAGDASSCGQSFSNDGRVIVEDVELSAAMAGSPDLEEYRRSGIRAVQSTPLVSRSGRRLGVLSTHWRAPQRLSERDFHFYDLLTRQLADLMERAQSEAALRASEARYRTLFDSIDEGFCVVEVLFDGERPVDYRFLEANPAFTHQTGLVDATGRTMRELVPAHEVHWFEIYGRVALTGEPTRFDAPAEALGRWYDVYAFRVGKAADRRVAILFSDITSKRGAEAALRASDARHAFLLELNDALRPLVDTEEIRVTAARLLGGHLNVVRVHYMDAAADDDTLIAGPCYANGVPPIVGELRVSDFDDAALDAYRAGRTHVEHDSASTALNAAQRASFEALGIRAAVGVPLAKNGRLIGVLGVHDAKPRGWMPAEIAVIEQTAERTWEAVERARAEAALRASKERQAFLLKLSDALRPLAEPAAIQAEAMRVLGEHLGDVRAQYWEAEPDGEHFVSEGGYAKGMERIRGRARMADFGVHVQEALTAGRTLAVADAAADPRVSEAELAAYRAFGFWAYMGVPLVKEGRLVAALGLYRASAHEWTNEEIALAEETADRTWAAVERARAESALRETRQRLDDALTTARMAYWHWDPGTGRTVASPSMDDLLGLRPGQHFESSMQLLALVHPDDRERHRALIERSHARGEGWHAEFRIARPSDGEIVYLEEVATVAVDSVTGVRRTTGLVWDVAQRKRAEAAAERERVVRDRDDLRRQLAEAEEAERRRLARELHDELGQQLTAFALVTDDALRLAATHDSADNAPDAPLVRRLGQLHALARQMQAGARYLALELRPPELDDFGFESALDTYVREWSARYGIAAEVAVTESASARPLSAEVSSALYRIVQEALTNVAKHAQARQVGVIVEKPNGQVRLIVEDDGRGFDLAETIERARKERRLGLSGMRERAALLGGTLEIESNADGNGTSLYVRVPLDLTGGDPDASQARTYIAPAENAPGAETPEGEAHQ